MEFFRPERVVAFPTLSLASAIKGWDRRNGYYFAMIESLAKHYKFTVSTAPFEAVPPAPVHSRPARLGAGRRQIPAHHGREGGFAGGAAQQEAPFEGILPNMARRYRETDSPVVREELARYRSNKPCPTAGHAPAPRGAT